MTLYKLLDKSFDERQFADVLERLDAYVLAQMLAGLDMKYDIIGGRQNHAGNEHQIVVFSKVLKRGFKLVLYENQSLAIKGVFHIQVHQNEIDVKEIRRKLKELGLKADMKTWDGKISYAVRLKNRHQYVNMIEIFKDQLP